MRRRCHVTPDFRYLREEFPGGTNPSGGPQPVVQLPPVFGAPPPPFFAPTAPTPPPAGAPNGPAQNTLFGPLPIYQNPGNHGSGSIVDHDSKCVQSPSRFETNIGS